MKPIFEEERLGILKEHGIDIPQYCWRDGVKIYLNANDEYPIMVLQVEELLGKIKIKKNFIQSIDGNKIHIKGKYKNKTIDEVRINKTFQEELDSETRKRLNKLIGQHVKMTIGFLNDHTEGQTRISISGGKDSSVMNFLFKRWVLPKLKNKEFVYDGFNTTNDVADTYKQMYKEGLTKDNINNPLIYINDEAYEKMVKAGFKEENFIIKGKKKYYHLGWYQWIEFVKEWWIPNALKRGCCSTYKEGQIKLILDKNKKYNILTGVRKYESAKRADYEFNIVEAIKKTKGESYLNLPKLWNRIAPICYMADVDVWLIILMYKLDINNMYKYGFERVGCLCCPYASPYTNLLIKYYYPKQWQRWMNVLKNNYTLKNVKPRLKWSYEEYSEGGKWRTGMSKEYEILSKKKTKDRIKELAKLKGISEAMAEKYWDKKCDCGKKLNPDEIAMNYKLFGRYEDISANEDNRQLYCKKCMCKKLGITSKEYTEKVMEFRAQGCELF